MLSIDIILTAVLLGLTVWRVLAVDKSNKRKIRRDRWFVTLLVLDAIFLLPILAVVVISYYNFTYFQ